jgi:hypothetical protein
MRAPRLPLSPSQILTGIGAWVARLSFVLSFLTFQLVHADIPDQPSGEFRGVYKIASSNDPSFPCQSKEEWFLDFGDGISHGKFSGNVSVSLRQNPRVKVSLMVWQYFPKAGNIRLGNQTHEGSKSAVIAGDWQLRQASGGILFERGSYRTLLQRAAPDDY